MHCTTNIPMSLKLLITLPVIFFSCNDGKIKRQNVDSISTSNSKKNEIEIPKGPGNQAMNIPYDTSSFDFLIYLVKNEISLNNHWTQKLKKLDEFVLPLDSTSHLSIKRDWVINDSISVIILEHYDGTGADEYLLTVKNKRDFVSKVHISNHSDSDASSEIPDY